MEMELKVAACSGDIEFLRKAVTTKPEAYFLTEYKPRKEDEDEELKGNIFNLAARELKHDFFKKAMELLPIHIKLQLLSVSPQKDVHNPLHNLAWDHSEEHTLGMVKMVLDFYRSYSGLEPLTDGYKPWLAIYCTSGIPLHFALETVFTNQEIAMELLSMGDMEVQCLSVDTKGKSPLFYAFEKGCAAVAEKILTMPAASYSVAGPDGSTPLHFAPNISETAVKELLDKNPELMHARDDNGRNVLHQWAETGEIWPLNLLLKIPDATTEVFGYLILQTTTEKERWDNPLHIAAKHGNLEFVTLIVDVYQEAVTIEHFPQSYDGPPWKLKNADGNTPFVTAIFAEQQYVALYFISIDPTLCHIFDNQGRSPLLVAVSKGCDQVVDQILWTYPDPPSNMLRAYDGKTVLHYLHHLKHARKTAKRLLKKFWWMINLTDDKGRTALDEAKESNIPWLIELLINPSLIKKEPFDWIKSCERDEVWAVLAFIDSCPNLHKICIEKNDTPLHHIKLQKYQDYIKLLKNPSILELKNKVDLNGATPLHRAIEKEDMLLAKVLLIYARVDRNIEDNNGVTPMMLLAKLCKENHIWEKMCKDMKVNRNLRTTHNQTNLGEKRNALLVVAVLVATITFVAAFTLPGGRNNEDTNTMVAFMSGVYAMVANTSSWTVIIIFVMCSFMFLLANRTILHNTLAWLIPTTEERRGGGFRSLQEEKMCKDMKVNRNLRTTHNQTNLGEKRNALLVVAALVATITFVAAFTLPGGRNNEDTNTMVAFMSGVYAMVANTSSSTVIIIFVTCSFMFLLANRTILHNTLAWLIPVTEERRDGFRSLQEIVSSDNQDQDGQISLLEEVEAVTGENVDSEKAKGSTSHACISKLKSY